MGFFRREQRTSIANQFYEREKEQALVKERKIQADRKIAEIRARARIDAARETAPRQSITRSVGSSFASGLGAAERHFNAPPKRRAPKARQTRTRTVYVQAARPRSSRVRTVYVQAAPRRRKKKKQPRARGPFDFGF